MMATRNEKPAQPLDLEDLTRVLEEELRLYETFVDCLSRQRDALVKLDRPRLEAAHRELDALILEVRRVSVARQGMVSRIAPAYGRKGETLRDLAEAAPEPYRGRFARLRRDLLAQTKRIQDLAGVSRTLVEDALGRLKSFVKLLAGMAGPPPVYANPRSAPSSALMDRTA